MIMESAMMVLLAVVLGTAVVTDFRSSRIPNWLTLPAIVAGICAQTWTNGMAGMMFSLAGLGGGLALFLILHLSGNIGAGDVKLMAAVGAMVGPYGALLSGLLAIIVGGVYAIGAMCYQWGFFNTGRKLAYATHGALLMGGRVWAQELQLPFRLRYGLAIAGGTLLFQLGLHPFRG
jgi:prepilin peptidase CpaA